jgi:hypothetical protein
MREECELYVNQELMHMLIDSIRECFERCDSEAICSNFSSIVLALDELIEFGFPFNTAYFT